MWLQEKVMQSQEFFIDFPQVHYWMKKSEVRGGERIGLLRNTQFSSVDQSCPTLCNPMNRSMPGLPVHH